MTLLYCNGCKHLKSIEESGKNHSWCRKEDRRSIDSECISEKAMRQFIRNDKLGKSKHLTPAIEMFCYQQISYPE